MRGRLIAFEGLDQSGKASQAGRLAAWLASTGRPSHLVSFPDYETAIGEALARALRGDTTYPPDVMQLLFVANRYEHRPRLEAWLAAGEDVVCDRYIASSVAYGEACGVDPEWLADIQRLLPRPDLTIFLDIAPETAVARKATDRDRYERDLALLARVRASYLRQARDPSWVRLDGERSLDAVAAEVARVVAARLGRP
jgi:dTMP kinase